jgi:hypothetical protein
MPENEATGGGPRRTFPPYSPSDVDTIKSAMKSGHDMHCPVCDGALEILPFDMLGTLGDEAFEIRCDPCRRFLVVREKPPAAS